MRASTAVLVCVVINKTSYPTPTVCSKPSIFYTGQQGSPTQSLNRWQPFSIEWKQDIKCHHEAHSRTAESISKTRDRLGPNSEKSDLQGATTGSTDVGTLSEDEGCTEKIVQVEETPGKDQLFSAGKRVDHKVACGLNQPVGRLTTGWKDYPRNRLAGHEGKRWRNGSKTKAERAYQERRKAGLKKEKGP